MNVAPKAKIKLVGKYVYMYTQCVYVCECCVVFHYMANILSCTVNIKCDCYMYYICVDVSSLHTVFIELKVILFKPLFKLSKPPAETTNQPLNYWPEQTYSIQLHTLTFHYYVIYIFDM